MYTTDHFKGDPIKEIEPIIVHYFQSERVSDGQPSSVTCSLHSFECPTDRNPPLYEDRGSWPPPQPLTQSLTNKGVQLLVTLTADLSSIPRQQMPKRSGADGQMYFHCDFEIRVTFQSAHTTYSLWYNNKCYGAVDAEYAGE